LTRVSSTLQTLVTPHCVPPKPRNLGAGVTSTTGAGGYPASLSGPPVSAQNPFEIYSQHLFGDFCTAMQVDQEDGHMLGSQHPHPGFLETFFPARLILVYRGLRSSIAAGVFNYCRNRSTGAFSNSAHFQTKIHFEKIVQDANRARLLRWYLPLSRLTSACKRGPKPPCGTPSGSSARVFAPQMGQFNVCKRYSVTSTWLAGFLPPDDDQGWGLPRSVCLHSDDNWLA